MQDAREGFKKATYSPTAGVQSFYDSLLDHAQNMAIYPDDYSILEQFLTGIPQDMATKMFKNFGLSPEIHSLDDLVAMAKAIEQRSQTNIHYEVMRRSIRGNATTYTKKAMPKAPSPARTPASFRFNGQRPKQRQQLRFSQQ